MALFVYTLTHQQFHVHTQQKQEVSLYDPVVSKTSCIGSFETFDQAVTAKKAAELYLKSGDDEDLEHKECRDKAKVAARKAVNSMSASSGSQLHSSSFLARARVRADSDSMNDMSLDTSFSGSSQEGTNLSMSTNSRAERTHVSVNDWPFLKSAGANQADPWVEKSQSCLMIGQKKVPTVSPEKEKI